MRLALLLAALPATALAWHDVAPVPEYSAATLGDGEWEVGPFRIGYGVTHTVDLGTTTIPWLLKTPNLQVKWRFLGAPLDDGWSFAVRTGLFTLQPHNYDDDIDEDLRFNLVPIAAVATWKTGDWRFNLTAGYTYVGTNADDVDVEDAELEGVAAVSTASLSPAVEWRLGRVFALVLEGHVKLWQQALAESKQTLEYNGGRTRVEIFESGEASVDDGLQANLVLSGVWAWEVFHLRVGGGYGHYNVPLVDLYLPDPSFVPEIDLYWRW